MVLRRNNLHSTISIVPIYQSTIPDSQRPDGDDHLTDISTLEYEPDPLHEPKIQIQLSRSTKFGLLMCGLVFCRRTSTSQQSATWLMITAIGTADRLLFGEGVRTGSRLLIYDCKVEVIKSLVAQTTSKRIVPQGPPRIPNAALIFTHSASMPLWMCIAKVL
jgi:hypothetical protein